ncbi:hypothetical protein BpHYR1_002596 [Brachionus plicatilis]|uniref:Uncharacterized protein n=1 Tax=Brachionus plicatilis TaxID=10195 RepID=A0A3M7RN10_BRAPC|nr:hypothetical protein BpHYR1_002596 [Brachionus plicatilis]
MLAMLPHSLDPDRRLKFEIEIKRSKYKFFFLSHNFDNSILNLNLSFKFSNFNQLTFDHLNMIMNFKLPNK